MCCFRVLEQSDIYIVVVKILHFKDCLHHDIKDICVSNVQRQILTYFYSFKFLLFHLIGYIYTKRCLQFVFNVG